MSMAHNRFVAISHWTRVSFAVIACATCFTTKSAETTRKLGVYVLSDYEDGWKGSLSLSSDENPYADFWKIMTTTSSAAAADPKQSQRFSNEQVNIETVIPIPNSGKKSWDDFDLVFFFGHNNTIPPPHAMDAFGYSHYTGTKYDTDPSKWEEKVGDLDNVWGTPQATYDYYVLRPTAAAQFLPGAVTYLYYKYTSSLLGFPYDYAGRGIDPGSYYRLRWDSPIKSVSYGMLGDKELEWLILHGCQAVITSGENGNYSPLAAKCFSKVHGKWHIILGHYIAYSDPPDLTPFAYDLLAGVPIQSAYFDLQCENNTSAIAAEKSPFDWKTSTMATDRWDAPMADNVDTKVYSCRWITKSGFPTQHSPSAQAQTQATAQLANAQKLTPQGAATLNTRVGRARREAVLIAGRSLLNETSLAIPSASARTLLKTNAISLRRNLTEYTPPNGIPVLRLEKITPELCRQRLTAAAKELGVTVPAGQIRDLTDALVIKTDEIAGWASLRSGAFRVMRLGAPMSIRSNYTDPQQPVLTALDFLARGRFVELADGEEMDLLFVRLVNNAVVQTDSLDTPTEQFASDYYVGFGRRYRGVPVIGSKIVLRINGTGEVVMMNRNWRRIDGVSPQTMVLSKKPIGELVSNDRLFARRTRAIEPRNVSVVAKECGYLEAPCGYEQPELRIGGLVRYHESPRQDEDCSKTTVPLEDGVTLDQLLGRF